MEKKNFVSLVLGTVGGLVFGLGMCMCLITEWGPSPPVWRWAPSDAPSCS